MIPCRQMQALQEFNDSKYGYYGQRTSGGEKESQHKKIKII